MIDDSDARGQRGRGAAAPPDAGHDGAAHRRPGPRDGRRRRSRRATCATLMIGAANVDEAEFDDAGRRVVRPRTQPPPRVRRRSAPVPRFAPRAARAARRARGVPPADSRVLDRARHRHPVLAGHPPGRPPAARVSGRLTGCRSPSARARAVTVVSLDQVPRLEAAVGAGPRRDLPRGRRASRRSTCSPAPHGSPRSSSGAART